MMHKIKLIVLSTSGVALFCAAGFLYSWNTISGEVYFKMYAAGILAWAIRMRMQAVNKIDALLLNITMWLCIFNLMDELFSRTPAKPYKPWIATIVIIITSLYIHYKRCSRKTNN